jgi:hypothetical protein
MWGNKSTSVQPIHSKKTILLKFHVGGNILSSINFRFLRVSPPRRQGAEHNRNAERWDSMQRIFISYSRKDMDFVRKLAGDLEKAGYDVWWDISDLRGGDDWVRLIPDAISSSQFVLVVLTPTSIESEWVRKEYTQALSLRKKVIPLMLVPSSVPFSLNTINFINFAVGEYTDNYKKLLEAMDYTGQPPVVQPFEKRILPEGFRKFAIPITLGILLLFALVFAFKSPPVVAPTPTPTLPPSGTRTPTLEAATPTTADTATPTLTRSLTATATQTVSQTPTITRTASPIPTFRLLLELCIRNLDVYTIYVRSGPSQKYAPLGELLRVRDDSGAFKNVCLWFQARNENEDGIWFLVAPGQTDPALRQYEGGWILSDLLGASPIELPLVTLTPTFTPSNTSTASATPSRTPTLTPTDTPSATQTPTDTPSSTATETDTPTPSETPTP